MTLALETLEVELPNGSDGDSLVHVRLPRTGHSVLFDAGDPRRLEDRDVLRLSDLFVSHCHVDHFVGFDALVRPRVCRPDRLTAHGPEGFLAHVEARLRGYVWNLVEGNHFVLEAREVAGERVRRARFDSGRAFEREELDDERVDGRVAWRDSRFSVESAPLDHHVVSQGWALQMRPRLTARMDRVRERGLAAGAWIALLKTAVEAGHDLREPFLLPDGASVPLGEARDAFLQVRAGDRVTFVTDTCCSAETRPRIVELAAAADVFACGAPFTDDQAQRAEAVKHLTARQAGELAAEAGARTLLLFHASDRYGGDWRRHVDEAVQGARGRVEVVTRRPHAS